MMDFSGAAGAATSFDLLPKGLLVWAILQVRGVKLSGGGSRYLDVELTVDQGQPFAGRKLFDKIGDPFFEGNSEKYRQMGMVAITRILEAGRNAGPHNPAGYQLNDFTQLNGLRVPIKVGIEDGTDGHDDKNRVADFLTPNPQSQSGFKGFEKLRNGDHGLPTQQPANSNGFGGAAAQPQTTGGFGQGVSAAAQTQPAATTGFGNTGSGFQQPPADSSGQSAAANGAGFATGQPGAGFAGTGTAPMASPSDPTAPPNWLQQAGSAAAQG